MFYFERSYVFGELPVEHQSAVRRSARFCLCWTRIYLLGVLRLLFFSLSNLF